MGRRRPPARHDRCRRLQAVHLPAAVLQAAVRRVRRRDAGCARGIRRRCRRSPPIQRTTASRFRPRRHWRDVRQVAKNVGTAIQSAMRAIETANPDKLYGIFGDAQWTNKERLPDATLRDLIEHFSHARADGGQRARGRAGPGLRIPDQEVRGRLRPHRGRVLHQPHRRPSDDRDARAAARRVDLRPHLRLGRHAALVRRAAAPAGQGMAQRAALRAGAQPHDLLHRPDELLPPRRRGLPDRARRHAGRAEVRGGRPPEAASTWCSPIRRTRSSSGTATPSPPTPGDATSTARRRRAAPTTPSGSTSSPASSREDRAAAPSSSRTACCSARRKPRCGAS